MPTAVDWVGQTDRDFENALTLPGRVYWDPAVFAREEQQIFGKDWLCVGHVSRLASPGDFFLVNLGRESVILAADKQGTPHAFYNVCRHRGTRVVNDASGSCRLFRCPYHDWAYGLDGRLMSAPNMEETPNFRREDFPLREVRLELWNGFLFINLDPDALPMSAVYDDFPDLSYLNLHRLQRVGYHHYDVDANWKLICENYNECYHCALAHPQLHRISVDREYPDLNHVGKHFTGGPMAIRQGFNTMTTSGVTDRAPLPGWKDSDKDMVMYFNLYPNLLLSIAPDYLLTHYIWPTGPETVYIETEWFCATEQIEQPGFDPRDAIEFWDTTNRQDWGLCENALRGLRSTGHRPGPYQSWETCVHDFDRWYVRRVFACQD
ncbi:MAG: aromatic ring-hydroxylating dioxygenase subunit alpha [Xanthomonadales bacterium]|nr:aromatic ring-hydroxylating dioxygenase subunit alpha [Xanthomonadales bacterium]